MTNQFNHLHINHNDNIDIIFELRKDQFCIEKDNKTFHAQIDIWNEKTKEYIDTTTLCDSKKQYSIGNINEYDKINCPDCIKHLDKINILD